MKATHRDFSKLQRNLVGPAIRLLRRSKKPRMTQEMLAGRLSVHDVSLNPRDISRIEKQRRYVRDIELQAIARILRVRVAKLLGM